MNKKERQNELLKLVPANVRESKELTRSTKVLLGSLLFLNCMDKAKENGCLYRSNQQLKDDTLISIPTLILSISHLIQLGFISRTVGKRGEGASIYTINDEAIKSYKWLDTMSVVSNFPYMNTNNPIEKLIDKVNVLEVEIKELKSMNIEIINRAVIDTELSNGAFRMLYIIASFCKNNNGNSVEIYNAQFMSLLDLSEKQVKRLTKELVELGYITKTVNGTSLNKKANTYILVNASTNFLK